MEPWLLPERELLSWVNALTGLSHERTEEARGQLACLGIGPLNNELARRPTVDAAVGAAFLWESMQRLEAAGVPRTKLVSKLRNDPDVWPTWAEIHAAAGIPRTASQFELMLEPGRSRGRHADFLISLDGGEPAAIEFKTLGLSDAEVVACRNAAAYIRRARPKRGIHNLHTELGTHELKVNRDRRRYAARQAEARARNLPPALREMAAVSVVEHGAEPAYLTRLRERFVAAIGQLPPDDPSWVAFHWSGGAPVDLMAKALSTVDLPSHVAGVIFFGTFLLVPEPVLHHFVIWLIAPFDQGGQVEVRSPWGTEPAAQRLHFVNEHSMPRAAIVWVPYRGRQIEILVRDGTRRIAPFGVIFGEDPPAHDLERTA